MEKTLLSLFLSISALPLFTQSSAELKQQTIIGLTNYRSEILRGNNEVLPKIKIFLQRLDSLNISMETRSDFFLNVSHSMNFFYANPKRVRKWAEKSKYNFIDHLSDEELKLIADNSVIFDLIVGGVLGSKYPFVIEKRTGIFAELAFYELQNNERIGEIGAGNGIFSLVVSIVFDSLFLAINELPETKVDYIFQKFKNCQSIQKNNTVRVLKGKKKVSNFENLNLDKVIMRISFHHFSHKKEMLTSIKKSLKPDGKIFILERLTDFGEKGCPHQLSKKEIIDSFDIIDFSLTKEQRMGNILLMEFSSTQ